MRFCSSIDLTRRGSSSLSGPNASGNPDATTRSRRGELLTLKWADVKGTDNHFPKDKEWRFAGHPNDGHHARTTADAPSPHGPRDGRAPRVVSARLYGGIRALGAEPRPSQSAVPRPAPRYCEYANDGWRPTANRDGAPWSSRPTNDAPLPTPLAGAPSRCRPRAGQAADNNDGRCDRSGMMVSRHRSGTISAPGWAVAEHMLCNSVSRMVAPTGFEPVFQP